MNVSIPNSIAARDKAFALHPFVDPLANIEPMVITHGKGVRVFDEEGRSYIDAVAGLWCASLGFDNERLARAAYEQMRKLPFYHAFTGKTNQPLVDLSERLVQLAPSPMSKVFLANSGSEANDTAIKLIWYYNNALKRPEKKKIIGRLRGYHGITLATASVTGQVINHTSFDLPLARFHHVQTPVFYHNGMPGESEEDYASRCAKELDDLIVAEGPDTVAAMFMEPIMGGGGVIVPPHTYYEKIQAVLRRHDVLVVADEVICGFGRTGSYWGSQTVGIEPDILTCAKALSAAFLPISAVLIGQKIVDAVAEETHAIGTFGHGFTYSGHPVPAAVALETLKIYDEENIISRAAETGQFLQAELKRRLAGHPLVGDVRGAGLIAGVEIVADKAERRNFAPADKIGPTLVRLCEANGVILRSCPNDTIALSPPLIINRAETTEIIDRMESGLDLIHATLRSGKPAMAAA
ncbi:aminotransferase class III-fold pyridoxal phosphate-dependent enzyme [Mesorhizobium sp. AD1-1]|uniref:aminotransferase n=1 Tax=Mesorhizobium sp. AD1-1 TaxID=2876621 RepID=UPI001CCBC7E7|nr:aminotransferase [Mesorhizobium sp. AD1-1]MBZ9719665.1 aminotransferase class III-fold pyridoxal phosphate-dependent enzyme [Mesorhizobium sp. AD1-1]